MNNSDNTVSVIDTAANTVVATIPAGTAVLYGDTVIPCWVSSVAVSSGGSKLYVAGSCGFLGAVSVIDTAANSVTA